MPHESATWRGRRDVSPSPGGTAWGSASSEGHASARSVLGREADRAGMCSLPRRSAGLSETRPAAPRAASVVGSLFASHPPDRAGAQAALSQAMSSGNTLGCSRHGARM